jgi:hypothetical protein
MALLEGLSALREINDIIRNQTSELPACNIASKPSMPQLILQRINIKVIKIKHIK